MDTIELTKEFIEKWASQYDHENIGDDEPEYNNILKKVQTEINDDKTLSKNTFFDIVNWKSPRAKGKINKKSFDLYQDAITLVLDIPDALKPGLLVWLDGIDIPVASTILHFI